ncbi:MAG: acyl-CoA dehydrogenase [Candidatus Pelagibacter sp.]|nr:acyl-CoA dehydrogenase [Candidatus Pelagibacter sp.]
MQIYKTPIKEYKFLIDDFLNMNESEVLKKQELDTSDLMLILDEASKLCEETLLPLNQTGDSEGCKFDSGNVYAPKGFKDAYKLFAENGWQGLKVKEEFGGQNLPYIMNMLLDEMISSTNMSFGLYPGLTANAIDAIEKSGSDELKNIYLPNLASGKWTGTMNLTEPQCGTDLGLSKTMATPNEDGSYSLTGTKIFITCGEHDLSENIIHLVLARTPDAPPGIKGISLFLVPKFLPNKNNIFDFKNGVECGSIEKKMGIHASPTCVMHYNEAKGWLVGEINKGMKAMFIMMNGARLFVGIQGLGLSETAFQSSFYYSKERLQGKLSSSNNVADPILVHPEIRKNLLYIKSINEAVRGLTLLTGNCFDLMESSKDTKEKKTAENFIALMTPIIKSYASDKSVENTNRAMQIYGGHGFITDHGMEQLVRDARITTIYEGTNGIQALDLIGRKLNIDNGILFDEFIELVDNYTNKIDKNPAMSNYLNLYLPSYEKFKDILNFIKSLNDEKEISSHAVEFLNLSSLISLGYVWLRFIEISLEKLKDSKDEFYNSKIETGNFFLTKLLTETQMLHDNIKSGGKYYNDYKDHYFETAI